MNAIIRNREAARKRRVQKRLDRWNAQGEVRFIFGYDCSDELHIRADDLENMAWNPLNRDPKYVVKAKPRSRPERVK